MAKKRVVPKGSKGKKGSEVTSSPGRLRSPNYPAVGLPAAAEFVRLLVEKDGKAGAPAETAIRHMGFSGLHGQSRTILSALKKFGLIEYKDGRVTPTEEAIIISRLPAGNSRKDEALRVVALRPAIYREVIKRYAVYGELPSDDTLGPEIGLDLEFNPKAVGDFLKDFRESLTYAGLLDGNVLRWDATMKGIVEGGRDAEAEDEEETVPVRLTPVAAVPAHALGMMASAPDRSPASDWTPVHPEPRSVRAGPSVRLDLANGNWIEIRMKAKVSPGEFEKVKRVFEMSEIAFVEESPTMISMMLHTGLTPDEEQKAMRLDGPLADLFMSAGVTVRFVEGVTEGDQRLIVFRDMNTGSRVASIPATEFMSLGDELVQVHILRQLRHRAARGDSP
jgi:hypothetical protein